MAKSSWIFGVTLVATTCMVGTAAEAEKMPPVASAKVSAAKHVFSMSCKVTAMNGDLATAEGRCRRLSLEWWRYAGCESAAI